MVCDRAAWRERWRANELAQIDRELRRATEGFTLVATFLRDHDEGGGLAADAADLAERAAALRRRCAELAGEG